MSALRSLADDERVLRLRKGLYLAPMVTGRLPSLPRAINLADPEGYISGHGALMLHGLDDQDISRWYSVTSRRQADMSYGRQGVHFVLSPTAAISGERTTLPLRGEQIVLATAAQAIVDEVRFMPYSLDYAAIARVLRSAIEVSRIEAHDLRASLGARPSVAATRRLGFLLELVQGKPDAELLAIARSQTGWTKTAGSDAAKDDTWRLFLPLERDLILRASR